MTDVSQFAGFPLVLTDEGLRFPDGIEATTVFERKLSELKAFLTSDNASALIEPIYRVWQGVHIAETPATPIRYDLTVLNPGTIKFASGEQEFSRTAGHYHVSEGTKTYPEIYEVISGRGHWLIQKPKADVQEIEEAYLVEANPGEKMLVPPGFGHITINTERVPLIESNVVASGFSYDYETYKKLKGGCYRLLQHGEASLIEIRSNQMYHGLPGIKKLKPKKDWFKGYFEPLWKVLTSHPEDLKFISAAETYAQHFFAIDRIYQEIL